MIRSAVEAAGARRTEMDRTFSRSRWVRSTALLILVAAALASLDDRALAVRGGETVLFGPVGVGGTRAYA